MLYYSEIKSVIK